MFRLVSAFVVTLLLVPSIVSSKILVEGFMNCKVKSNRVETIREGLPESYTGFKGGFSKGDILEFNYRLSGGNKNSVSLKNVMIALSLEDAERSEKFVGEVIWQERKQVFLNSSSVEFKYPRGAKANGEIWISPDYISFKNPYSLAWFEQYYKSDWQGMAIDISYDQFLVQIVSLDCRHTQDKISEMITYMKSLK